MNKYMNGAILSVAAIIGSSVSAMASVIQDPISVPEPTALGLLTMGVAGVVLARRLRKK
jgi:PEP-CTERM motif